MRSFDRVARSRRASSDLPRIGYRRNSSQETKHALEARNRPVTVADASPAAAGSSRASAVAQHGRLNLPSLTRTRANTGRMSLGRLARLSTSASAWAGSMPSPDELHELEARLGYEGQGRFSRLHFRPSAAIVAPGRLPETRPGTSTMGANLSRGQRSRLFIPSATWTDPAG